MRRQYKRNFLESMERAATWSSIFIVLYLYFQDCKDNIFSHIFNIYVKFIIK